MGGATASRGLPALPRSPVVLGGPGGDHGPLVIYREGPHVSGSVIYDALSLKLRNVRRAEILRRCEGPKYRSGERVGRRLWLLQLLERLLGSLRVGCFDQHLILFIFVHIRLRRQEGVRGELALEKLAPRVYELRPALLRCHWPVDEFVYKQWHANKRIGHIEHRTKIIHDPARAVDTDGEPRLCLNRDSACRSRPRPGDRADEPGQTQEKDGVRARNVDPSASIGRSHALDKSTLKEENGGRDAEEEGRYVGLGVRLQTSCLLGIWTWA